MKQAKVSENFSLCYSSRDADTNDTVMDLSINFDNPKDASVVIHRLNTWLKAIGMDKIVATHVSSEYASSSEWDEEE